MDGTTTERLRAYLAALSPRAQHLLARKLEREESGGNAAAVTRLLLEELRRPLQSLEEAKWLRDDETLQLVFRPLEPFLIDGNTSRLGAVRCNTLLQAWQWLKRDALAGPLRRLNTILADGANPARASDRAFAISDFQRAITIAMSEAANAPRDQLEAALTRIGLTLTGDDLAVMATLMRSRDLFETLDHTLPRAVGELSDGRFEAVKIALAVPALQRPALLPFALTLTMRHLREPWQILRLATRSIEPAAERDLTGSRYAVAIDLAIQHVEAADARLRNDLRRHNLGALESQLEALHHGLRGISVEFAIRPDPTGGHRLAAIRADISKVLQTEFEQLPLRVRRLLRQRVTAEIVPTTAIDVADVEQTAALIAFLAAARGFADELAVHEVTTRIWSQLGQYVGATSELLVAALRGCPVTAASFRRQQVDAAIAFSDVLFGTDHAVQLRRTADHAEQSPAPAIRSA